MKKRERIHQKYKGLCAYSGTPLEADWEVDHVEPIIRAGVVMFPNESDENLVPCQRVINRYKGAYPLEMFRGLLLTLHKRIKHTPRLPHRIAAKERLLRVAGYFGITPDQPWNGIFYFEQMEVKFTIKHQTKVSKTQKPANCGYTVLAAVFCQQEEELIANYMCEKATGGYHQSWDWLMPVVVKINSNGFFFFWEDYVVRICRWSDGSGSISKQSFLKGEDAFNAVYKCVVEFLNECYPVP